MAQNAQTKLTWYGQSAYKLVIPSGKVLLIDPWIQNPVFDKGEEEVASLKHVDLILLTHGHSDHVGESVEIAKQSGAKLVCNHDLSLAMKSVLGYPAKQAEVTTSGHIGGNVSILNGEVRIMFVPALHGSGIVRDDKSPLFYGGMPTGLVIMLRDGPTFYHTGDTDIFSDMALIPRFHHIDVMLACIGDHFTMGPERAAEAVKMVNPDTVIPNHYATFPVLTGTPEAFETELKKSGAKAKLRVMKVGETISL